MDFDKAVTLHRNAAILAAEAEHEADVAFAQALIVADGKSEGVRKAHADLASADLKLKAKIAAVEAAALKYIVHKAIGYGGRGDL